MILRGSVEVLFLSTDDTITYVTFTTVHDYVRKYGNAKRVTLQGRMKPFLLEEFRLD